MRVHFEFGDKAYWVDFKSTFSRLDMRIWVAAQDLREPTPEERENVEEIVERLPDLDPDALTESDYQALAAETRMLELLANWCDDCYLEDGIGNEYHNIEEIDVAALERMDWAVYDFLVGLPTTIRNKHARLGKVTDEQ